MVWKVAGIALLGPRVAAVVIAADFPVAGRIVLQKFDALKPLCALPEIEMRHHQPHRAAMLRLERCARPAMREQRVLAGKIFQREVGGIAVMGMQHHEARFIARLAGHQKIVGREPFPLIIIARPGGDAVDVGGEFCLRLPGELREIPENRFFHRAVDVEPPAFPRNLRRQAEIEDGPIPGQMLSRRQALLLGPRGFSGEEFALARPALLAARQL
jgi:hypothetical protein